MSWRYLCKTSWRCLEDAFPRRLEDILRTSWRHLGKTSWRCLEDALKRSSKRFEDVLKMSGRRFCKTSLRRLENVLKTRRLAKANILVLIKTSWRRLEDVFWRRMIKANIFVLMKTSSENKDERRLQDVFKTSSSRRMFAGNQLSLFLVNYNNTDQ